MKSGFVSIVGRPNVGKSTLLNKLLNKKIAITSDKVGTTRNTIYGIYNDEDSQIVFVDTPGINKATSKLGEVLNNKAYSSFDNDLVLFLVDIASGFGPNDNRILNRLKEDIIHANYIFFLLFTLFVLFIFTFFLCFFLLFCLI